ncbi:CARDB domain-containing protein [Melittangium boletus]|uniref:CARDB domain-containing protein n=1 Tax=Melittangium boletus TaxID=83453 RepID=UPI000BB39E44|nr:CARDB domain-containing protein [Melittangium boletus]
MIHFKRSRLFLRTACAIPLLTSACTPAGDSRDGQDVAPLGVAVAVRSASAAATVLSAGKPASASSSNAPYTANNLTDGNQGSYWESANGAFPQWAQVDLGSAATVEDVVLRLPAGWGTRDETLSIQSSTDGSSFTTLKASTSYAFNPSTGNTVTIDVPDTSARYVRVTITANTGWGAGQLSEFEVRGTASTPPTDPPPNPPTGSNLALGKSIVGSSTEWQFVATNANDGRTDTYWEGAGGQYPSHLTVSLGTNVDLTGVVVKLPPATEWATRTQTFEVQGRGQAGGSWSTLKASAAYTFNPATGNSVTVPFTGTAADVRLVFTGNTGSGNGQVAEFQVHGIPSANPDLTVTAVTATPGSPIESDTITLTATVKNVGTKPSPATSVNLTVDGAAAATAAVASLAAGATTTVSAPIGKKSAGSYTIGAVVDPDSTVVEQNESNNAFSNPTKLTVSEAPGPDLQVLSITPNPANPAIGTPVKFSVAVKNRGTTAVGAATVTRVAVGGSTLDTTTPAVAAGATVTVTTTGSWTATSGGATVTATADATGVVAETNESNNTFSQSIVVGRGAAIPWVTYEAEAGRYQGTLLETDPLRTFGHTNFATESSGRKSVRLNSTGQYVEFTSTHPTNSIVVRNAIPDAPNGGGQEATISLYANGTFVQKLTLSSRHSWLYGNTDGPEALTNTPQADARRLFDESHALLAQSYPAGTTFRLQRDASDTASFYIIDLIDLEQVAPPASKPAECTSITNYGAVPNDGIDDTDAIQRAVTDDQNGVISCVWIPAGQWRQEKKILTDDPLNRGMYNQVGIRNVTIRGAGMWHSQLYTTIEPHNQTGSINHPHEGNFGFDIDDNVQISDIAIFGSGRIRGGDGNAEGGVALNGRFGKNTKITNVWIEHANVAVWVGRDYDNIPELWGPADGLQFSGMRIRDTYADGINFSNGTRNSRVFNSSFRTTGDDSLAVWANPYVKDRSVDIAHDNHFVNNTIQLPWRANGIAIYGGYGNTIENNLIYDTMNYPGIMLATDHDPLPFSGTTLIANNGLYRTGGAFWNEDQEFGAITLFPSTRDITGVTIRDTDIYDSTYDGIQFKNGGGNMPDVVISNVRISNSINGAGILAMSGARGNTTLTNVTITGSADGNIVKQPGSQFVINGG